jgi:thioesterase domain-containing protein
LSVEALLAELQRLGVQVRVESGNLRLGGAPGLITPELKDRIVQLKPQLVAALERLAVEAGCTSIVPLQAGEGRLPVFAVAGHNGDVFCYRHLVSRLDREQPFFGLQPPGIDGGSAPLDSVKDLARHYADQIEAWQPHGPLVIAGFCAGGTIAWELVAQLQQRGREVVRLLFLGCSHPSAYRGLRLFTGRVVELLERAFKHVRALLQDPLGIVSHVRSGLSRRREAQAARQRDPSPTIAWRLAVEEHTMHGARRYTPQSLPVSVSFIIPSETWGRSLDAPRKWRRHVRDYREYVGPEGCVVDTMLLEPHVDVTAGFVRDCLADCNKGR